MFNRTQQAKKNTFKNQFRKYLFNFILTSVRLYNTRNANNIPQFEVKHNFFQNSLFHSVNGKEWNGNGI